MGVVRTVAEEPHLRRHELNDTADLKVRGYGRATPTPLRPSHTPTPTSRTNDTADLKVRGYDRHTRGTADVTNK
jgi:hypothetical protein